MKKSENWIWLIEWPVKDDRAVMYASPYELPATALNEAERLLEQDPELKRMVGKRGPTLRQVYLLNDDS